MSFQCFTHVHTCAQGLGMEVPTHAHTCVYGQIYVYTFSHSPPRPSHTVVSTEVTLSFSLPSPGHFLGPLHPWPLGPERSV